MKTILPIFALLLLLYSCNFKKEKGKVIASVYDKNLYAEDIIDIVPEGAKYNDSLNIVRDFINQWVKKQVVLHKALNNDYNLDSENKKRERQVEDYRNTLIIYQYQRHLVDQRLDTVVSNQEIEEYYNNHKKEFTLKGDIVQVAFVKFNNDFKNLKPVRKLFKDYSPENLIKIENIAKGKSANYFLDDDTWILYSDLVKEIPIETYNKSLFLKNNKYIELKDSLYTYMLRINNYKIEDSVSPLAFEYDNIRSLIINIRKMQLIDKMEEDVFKEAQEEGAIYIEN